MGRLRPHRLRGGARTSAADVAVDDSAEELTYGESDLGFCLDVLAAAASSSTDRRGFCDLGAGRGAIALGVALAEPQLEGGSGAAEASEVVALEVVPELSAIASAAFAVASDARLLSLQGSFYDHDVRSAHARDPAAERPADPHHSPAQLLRSAVRRSFTRTRPSSTLRTGSTRRGLATALGCG